MMTQRIEVASPPRLERRRYTRWALDRAARLSAADGGLAARCLDVSVGGALLKLQTVGKIPDRPLLYLFLSSLGGTPAAILARVVEVRGTKVRVAFDPLPDFVARALEAEIHTPRMPPSGRGGALLN